MTTKIPVELSSTPGISDSSNATAITIDSSENSTFAGNIVKGNLTISGTEIDLSSGDLTLDVAGTISLDTDSGGLYFKDGGTTIGEFINSSSDLMIKSAVQDKDILLKGDDGGSTITALQLDMSEAGAATFNSTINGLTLAAGSVATSTSQNFALNTPNSLRINIDSNDSATDQIFVIGHNQTAVDGSNSFFLINESGFIGMGDTPSNLTSEIVTITTPASGGGQGIAFKRLDTNSDQVCGQIRWSNNSTDDLAFIKAKTDGANTAGAIQFFTNTGSGIGEKARINKNGVFMLGTTTPKSAGDNPTDENSTVFGPGYLYLQRDDSSSINQVIFGKDGQTVGNIITTTATSYVSASDYRMKENVDYTWDATSRLKQLKPARYNWIADETNTLEDGFLAHEVATVVPNAVFGEKDAVDSNGNPEMQGVDPGKLIPLLVKTIQELEARIATIEGE